MSVRSTRECLICKSTTKACGARIYNAQLSKRFRARFYLCTECTTWLNKNRDKFVQKWIATPQYNEWFSSRTYSMKG